MDKSKILNNYMKEIYAKMDELRVNYPGSRSAEILEMEKGYRFCAMKSAEWIEELLSNLESSTSSFSEKDVNEFMNEFKKELHSITANAPLQTPIQNAVDRSIDVTNKIADEPTLKKKPLLKVLAEGFTDMGKDLYNAGSKTTWKKDKDEKDYVI